MRRDSPWDYQPRPPSVAAFILGPRGIEIPASAQVGPEAGSPVGCSPRSAAGGGPCATEAPSSRYWLTSPGTPPGTTRIASRQRPRQWMAGLVGLDWFG